ncbi:hypothetical protein AWB79_06670 [Caballeronia hypogeia]|uniref:Preprotein translocase subunit SecA n=1 Tax=Caballeronia hypogeia TaxID=1777140 RepID=A0A158DBD7_9BURK|nr:hypothetical protein [Caballeronia hypogeia]SAK91107.1 hypothetical protein AWB79_06670 [Caballeronia hypogeia]
MLSPHEIATLLLVERAPHQVEPYGQPAARLRQEALVEIERLPTGVPVPLLTPKGRDMLQRLDARWKLHSAADEASE